MPTLRERFDQFEDDFLTSEEPGSKQLRVFNFLDKKFPDIPYIVSAAEHDQIWLGVTTEQLETLTDDEIKYIVRNGAGFDGDTESLYMFV